MKNSPFSSAYACASCAPGVSGAIHHVGAGACLSLHFALVCQVSLVASKRHHQRRVALALQLSNLGGKRAC